MAATPESDTFIRSHRIGIQIKRKQNNFLGFGNFNFSSFSSDAGTLTISIQPGGRGTLLVPSHRKKINISPVRSKRNKCFILNFIVIFHFPSIHWRNFLRENVVRPLSPGEIVSNWDSCPSRKSLPKTRALHTIRKKLNAE